MLLFDDIPGYLKGYRTLFGLLGSTWRIAKTLEGGYLHTGDLATRDRDGHYYITGRKKDIILTAGKGVASPEIENVISLHPAVSGVAVIGVPDKELGEIVKAFVVLKEGEKATEHDITQWCSSPSCQASCSTPCGFSCSKS